MRRKTRMHLAGKRRARACIYAPGTKKVKITTLTMTIPGASGSSVRDLDKEQISGMFRTVPGQLARGPHTYWARLLQGAEISN